MPRPFLFPSPSTRWPTPSRLNPTKSVSLTKVFEETEAISLGGSKSTKGDENLPREDSQSSGLSKNAREHLKRRDTYQNALVDFRNEQIQEEHASDLNIPISSFKFLWYVHRVLLQSLEYTTPAGATMSHASSGGNALRSCAAFSTLPCLLRWTLGQSYSSRSLSSSRPFT